MNCSEPKQSSGNYSDEELVKLIKSGNKVAFDELVHRYSKTVALLSHSYKADTLTADDWFQEGMLGLIKATSSFKPDAGAVFATFASICIRNRLNSVYRKTHNSKNASFLNTREFNENDNIQVSSPEEDYISQEQYISLTSDLTKQLSSTEWEVFCCYLAGQGNRQIANKLKITEKSAENALYRAKSKIKRALKPN